MDLVGEYRGRHRVREGREHELTRDEVKRYLKSKEDLSLEIRADGAFSHKGVSHGRWVAHGDRIRFTPSAFGDQALEAMRSATERSGRAFTLAFLFEPFELLSSEDGLVTPDPTSLIYTEYRHT